jgi:hypothetical protein
MGKLFTRSLLVIDESFRLYRSHFVHFTSLAALYVLPVIAVILGLMLTLPKATSGSFLFNFLGALLLIWLFGIYNLSSLSKAALSASRGEIPSLIQALHIRPTRLLGVAFFSLINYIIINIMVSMLFLPLSFLIIFITSFMGFLMNLSGGSNGGPSIAYLISSFLTGLVFFLTMAISFISTVASIIIVIYSLQGLIHYPSKMSDRINRTFSLLFFNFGRNLLVSIISAGLIIGLSIAIGILVSTVIYYPIELLSITRFDTSDILLFTAFSLASILLLPIMPIIAAVLYQHNGYEYDAQELSDRFEKLPFARQTEVNPEQRV